jgi:hypothetical protein
LFRVFFFLTSPIISASIFALILNMSDTYKPTVEELNAELAKSKLEMEAKMNTLQEKLQPAPECKEAEEEAARKAEEAWQKAEAEEKTEAERKAKAKREAEEAREKAEAEEKAKVEKKAREEREATETQEEEVASKAKWVHLANRKRLDQELIEFKERTEVEAKKKAEEKKKNQGRDGMMLATSADLSALDRAWQINAENAKIREEGFKPWAGSSKATATPTPKLKALVNLSRQVRNEEAIRKTRKWGKSGDVAVSVSFRSYLAFLTCLSPGCHARHVRESQGSLCVRVSGGLSHVSATKSLVLVSELEMETQGRRD